MGLFDRLAAGTRATALPAPANKGGKPTLGNYSVAYSTPGVPETPRWDAAAAVENAYYVSPYVMRGVRAIAEAVAGLPFRAGTNPEASNEFNPAAPLARLLGPAPGGPNPTTSARALWKWTIVQKLLTGRYGWEIELDAAGRPAALWPLVSAYIQPVPTGSPSGPHWSEFAYNLPTGLKRIPAARMFYAWRHSQRDWWQPESPLEAASDDINVARMINRYNLGLLRNGMVAAKMVITPEFADDAEYRAFQDEMTSMFMGVENAGRTVFAEMTPTVDAQGKPGVSPSVQVVDLAQNGADAELQAVKLAADRACLKALGVPESIAMGDASERTYANSDQEHRNFWTGPVYETVMELQDEINVGLAPLLGDELGWFDLSGVEALKPARIFAPIAADNAVKGGLAVAEDWRREVGLPPLPGDSAQSTPEPLPSAEDTPGASGGSTGSSSGGSRSDQRVPSATVHAYLRQNYPTGTLDWVHNATWTRRRVPLEKVAMRGRPGGRDDEKTQGIAAAIAAGKKMEPVVLVDTPDPDAKLKVADGYHRTKAHERAGLATIDAYVGQVDTNAGPWDSEMHDKKLNRAGQDLIEAWAESMDDLDDEGVRQVADVVDIGGRRAAS